MNCFIFFASLQSSSHCWQVLTVKWVQCVILESWWQHIACEGALTVTLKFVKCKFLNIFRKADDFSGRITNKKNDCFHFEILWEVEEQESTRGMALVLCLVFGARDINCYRSHENYRPVKTKVLHVKIKYKALGNSQESLQREASLCSMCSLEGFMAMWIKIIHSSTLMNFYFNFQNYYGNIPHKRKSRATEFWCIS